MKSAMRVRIKILTSVPAWIQRCVSSEIFGRERIKFYVFYILFEIFLLKHNDLDYENIEQFKKNNLEKYLLTQKEYAAEFGFEVIE